MPIHAKKAPARRLRLRFLAMFLVFILVTYLGWSLIAIPRAAYAGQVEALANPNTGTLSAIAWPAYGQAALGTSTSGLLASNGSQAAVPIASVAKVMVALTILREKPFDAGQQGETLTLTQSDVDIYRHYSSVDGSVALVAAGEKITEYQALQALLLPSANNIADTLAIWAFGSVNNYVTYANDYASELGLSQTHFNDASGFDSGSVSSAVNLIKLGQLALKNPVITDIASQRNATIPVAGTIHNVNWLLSSNNGFIGIKTGNTDEAGGCILFAATHMVADQKLTIIGAVLGAPNLQTALRDSIPLLASAKENFTNTTVVEAGQVVGHYETPWGRRVDAVTTKKLETVAWKGTNLKPQVVIIPVKMPAVSGQTVGKVVESGTSTADTSSASIRLAGDLSTPSWWWRVTHPAQVLQIR